MKVAAIGIGSNSLRMLVADVVDGMLMHPIRYREGLRVFAALDANRNISQEMIHNACQSVLVFQQEAVKQGAECIHLFATSATRDASNQTEFMGALEAATNLKLEICSGEKEASLSFWGSAENAPTGMIDIGGGSTELAVGCGKMIDDAVSLQMGAVRLHRLHPICSIEDAEKVTDMAADILMPVQNRFADDAHSLKWVGVGGTFTTSAALVQRIPWQKRELIHHYQMTQEKLKEAIDFLAPIPLEKKLQLECLQPQRADIVVHGMAILLACMRELNIPCITISEHGNLEGYLKEKYIFEKS